jgi:limonene-1,2-epoxide hydrolase
LRARIAARGRKVYLERASRRVLGERWRSLLESVL